jgi:signal recognition particle GTPase
MIKKVTVIETSIDPTIGVISWKVELEDKTSASLMWLKEEFLDNFNIVITDKIIDSCQKECKEELSEEEVANKILEKFFQDIKGKTINISIPENPE